MHFFAQGWPTLAHFARVGIPSAKFIDFNFDFRAVWPTLALIAGVGNSAQTILLTSRAPLRINLWRMQ
jgi:hypothetical protein